MKKLISLQNPVLRMISIVGGATLLSVFSASRIKLSYAYRDNAISWPQALAFTLPDWFAWMFLLPVIAWLVRHFRFERRRIWLAITVNAPASILLTVCKMGMEYWGVQKLSGNALREFPRLQFHSTYLTYWAIVGILYAFDYYSKYREHELRASQLEAQLAQAQLHALKMQLHPHFLFNTLHAISSLMHKDVAAADRMLARLSDLLRATLENVGEQEVTLKKELEFLERYLDIEKVRFQDRLKLIMEVQPDTFDCRVPNMILQPLVENAVRHGIAPRVRQSTITIRSHRREGLLCLEVEDDGEGFPSATMQEGVGLRTTRARLQQLYGNEHRFEIDSAVGQGVAVRLAIPLRGVIAG